ncbi:MAG: TlpA disulfide reductase family protein [Luteolibacter sp.]
MNRLSHLIALFPLLIASSSVASPADASLIQKNYQLAVDKWTLEMRVTTSQDERLKTWDQRPDAATAARKMWEQIGGSLNEEWTIEPAAWFLRNTQGLITTNPNGSTVPTFAKENDAIRKAIETSHIHSGKLTPICMALVANQDPRSLAILEKIQAGHPDKKIQGVAALGAAMQLKAIGDDPELMKKRLTYLRKAIIQSSDVEVNGTTVAKIAEDELYIIRFLTKGRVAPDLAGVDSANHPLSLSTNKGKVVVLLFWSSSDPDATRVIEITAAMEKKFKGRPLVIIGVNHDPSEKLRAMQADNTVTWSNFSDPENKLSAEYRVGTWPLVYVLDGERKIHYAGAPGSFVELTAEALVAEIK